MKSHNKENPLFEPQRETAGASTFEKYEYQYHWALFRIIQEHAAGNDYVVFVEMHEDVVVSDSLDENKALFEFNQVKTDSGKFTVNKLVKLKNGSSVLGKLVSNSDGKRFSTRLSSLNLVAANGYTLPLKQTGIKLSKIALSDIDDDTVKIIGAAIKKELSIDPLPTNIHFIIPALPDKKFQELIIGEISNLITSLFPGCNYNSVDICRILLDTLRRRGVISIDIKDWEELVREKGLTASTVTQVINQFTNIKDEALIESRFRTMITELGIKSIPAKKLERAFMRYRQNKVGNRSTLQIDISKELSDLITEAILNDIEDLREMIDWVKARLSSKISNQFKDESEAEGAIIYEFITQE